MKGITIKLPEMTLRQLRQEARATGRSVAEIVRGCLENRSDHTTARALRTCIPTERLCERRQMLAISRGHRRTRTLRLASISLSQHGQCHNYPYPTPMNLL